MKKLGISFSGSTPLTFLVLVLVCPVGKPTELFVSKAPRYRYFDNISKLLPY